MGTARRHDGEPVHRTILAFDVEGFTRRPRRDVDRLRMRGELYRLLEQALARAGLRREDFRSEDRGDGVLVLLNETIDCLEQSLRIRDGIQNPLSEAMSLTNLGEVHMRAGNRRTAVEF